MIIWQKSHKVAVEIAKLIRILPMDRVSDILGSQIIRSATSVPANIAEGFGRFKGKEYGRFLQIALGSANETDYWLTYLSEIYPSFKDAINVIMSFNLESCKLLSISLRKLSLVKS
jgi:four helix bundle protein